MDYQSTHQGIQVDNGIDIAIKSIAPNFSSTTQYRVDDIVRYNNALYICVVPHIGPWNGGADWREIILTDQIKSSLQKQLPEVIKDRYLHANAISGDLEWAEMSGRTTGGTWGTIEGDIQDQEDLMEQISGVRDYVDESIGIAMETIY